eukprot:CAMPEP_0117654092 /NCGR_PEP_ID=MMETSP0804-20121206/3555_1 /TAXON_ID=1074897 /ORGANISM="Tetraselmis astigmatica, Strain CCMP880" /LENGTH=536 /DNA_ID=CAMNT_0005460341 /DNA_START=285 /DNA_END=1895 /DNA_ORIENTATION=-
MSRPSPLPCPVAGFAMLIPVLPIVLTEFFAQRRAGGDEPINCASFPPAEEPEPCRNAHSDSVTWASGSSFVSQTILAFFLTPCLGNWSDRVGRKPFIVASAILTSMPLLVFFLNYFNYITMLWWYPALVLCQGVDRTSLSVALTADLVPPSLRAPAIGFVTASLAAAIFVGPILSAQLTTAQLIWTLPPLAAISILWATFMIPETTTEDSRAAAMMVAERRSKSRDLSGPLEGLRSSFMGTWAIVMRSRMFMTLTFIMMMVGVVQEGMQDLLLQYLQLKVSFNVANNSMLLELVGIGGLVSQLLLLRPLLCLLGEKWVLILSLLSQATQQLCLGLAGNKNEVWAALTIGVLGMMSFPTLSAIKSNNSAEHEQGAVQGALFGAKALAGGLGPLVLAQIFRMFTRTDSSLPYLPGMPFVLGACIMGLCAIVAATLPKNSAKTPGGVSGKYRAGPSDLETPFCQEGSSSDSGGGSSGDHVGRASWVAVVEPTLVSYYGETGGRGSAAGVDVSGSSSPMPLPLSPTRRPLLGTIGEAVVP